MGQIRQCVGCLGWGDLGRIRECHGCAGWRKQHPEPGRCLRCRHEAYVNTDELCRACLHAIRAEQDIAWVESPQASAPRDRQLMLVIYGLPRQPAQPLKKYRRRTTVGGRDRLRWLEHQRAQAGPLRDDPEVCPPAVKGQVALFTLQRYLPLEIVRRILHRPLDGYDELVPAMAAYAAEHSYSKPWLRQFQQMIRLALAVRDADGLDLIEEEALDDLQYYRQPAADFLRRVGLLRPRPERPSGEALLESRVPVVKVSPRLKSRTAVSVHRSSRREWRPGVKTPPPPPPPSGRSCEDCGAWIVAVRRTRCRPCQTWRGNREGLHPVGQCERCRRPDLPLGRDRLCRACLIHLRNHGPQAAVGQSTQLWFGGSFGHKLRVLDGELGYRPASSHPARDLAAAVTRPPRQPVSPHLVAVGQGTLFAVTRDWRPAADQRDHERFRLTDGAQRLLDELIELSRSQQWEEVPRTETIRTLKILLSWIGADAPIQEEDVHNLAQLRAGLTAKRVVQFLEPRGLLIPDGERRKDLDLRSIEQIIAGYPETIADELWVWVKVMRGEGRWEHTARSYHSIRRYFHPVGPVLDGWAARVTSLREITNQDVKNAIKTRQGNPGRMIHIVLRNLFRALKQERVIFRDPSRGLIFGGIQILPDSVPSDRLQTVLDHASNPFERLIVVLVAVHALGGTVITTLLHEDLDLAAGLLTVRRGSWRHTIFLDDLSHQVAANWITERHRRWPGTTNPHLLVSQQSAMHTGHPPITTSMFDHVFRSSGLTMQQVRQDRILFEARETTDPLHLMRLFGISDGTAMRYITAAHPERTAKIPR